MQNITIEDFSRIEIRVGRIIEAEQFPEARKPAYRLLIDFGSALVIKRSSAQITDLYKPVDLVGRLVAAVTNLPPRQMGPVLSEVLVLGFTDADGRVALVSPDHDVPLGAKLH